MSLSNYDIAKKVFSKDKMTFNKIIFEMKLYSVKHQIEALEKLVNKGFYDADLLKNAYEEYFKNYEIIQKLDSTIKPSNKNSFRYESGIILFGE